MRSLPLLLALTTFSLVGLFFLLKPVAPKPDPASATAQASAPDSKPAAAGIADGAAGNANSSGGDVERTAPASDTTVQVQYVVAQGQRVRGPDRVIAQQGQHVQIDVLSDRDDELHLHGYDLHLPLSAGKPVTLSLHAEHSGRFELELHKRHLSLAVLEVHPD